MASGSNCATDYIENRIINCFLRGTLLASASPYIGLFTSTTASGYETGVPVEEPSAGTGYMRMTGSGADRPRYTTERAYTTSGTYEPPVLYPLWYVSGASATNMYEIAFPTPTGTYTAVEYIGIVTGSSSTTTGSILYFYSNLDTKPVPDIGNELSIPVKAMQINLSDAYSAYLGNTILNWFLNATLPATGLPGNSVSIGLFRHLPDIYGKDGDEVPKDWSGESGSGFSTGDPYEPTGIILATTGYTRKLVGGKGNWSSPTIGYTDAQSALTTSLSWTAVGDWGIIEGYCIFENLTNNILFRGYLDTPRQVLKGDTFNIGAMRLRLG